MAITYDSIATTTLTSTSNGIDITGIPNTFTDLRLIVSGTQTSATFFLIRFNGDTAINYTTQNFRANGSATISTAINGGEIYLNDTSSGSIADSNIIFVVDIFGYAGSGNKAILSSHSNDNNTQGWVVNAAGAWRNSAAITSLRFFNTGGLFNIGTTVSLYGIKAA